MQPRLQFGPQKLPEHVSHLSPAQWPCRSSWHLHCPAGSHSGLISPCGTEQRGTRGGTVAERRGRMRTLHGAVFRSSGVRVYVCVCARGFSEREGVRIRLATRVQQITRDQKELGLHGTLPIPTELRAQQERILPSGGWRGADS